MGAMFISSSEKRQLNISIVGKRSIHELLVYVLETMVVHII